MTGSKKIDLRNKLKHLYGPSAREVVEVEVPEMRFLKLDGEGDPNTSETFREAVEALYAVSYALKFAGVTDLEEIREDKSAWKWTLLIMQPEWATEERFGRSLTSVRQKKSLPALSGMRLETFREGRAAQVMHVGPFAEEGPTLERLDRFIEERGGKMRGKHHEIYLSDFRRTAPERLKTIIRHPFE